MDFSLKWAQNPYKAMYPLPSQLDSISRDMGLKGAPYFPEAVVHDPELAAQLRLVFGQLDVCENRLTRESLVYHFLSQLISRHGKCRREPKQLSGAQRRLELVKEFLDDYPQADVSLEELARMAMLSPYHLVRSFSKAFGLPPHAYQIQSRLRVAKKLLRHGYNVAQVAQDTGFHDQSHLHRHFKKALGVTPGQFASLQ